MKMKKTLWLVLPVLVMLALVGCTKPTTTPTDGPTQPAPKVDPAPDQEGFTTYIEDVYYNISIQYPDDWELGAEDTDEVIAEFFSPDSSDGDPFIENVNIGSESLLGGTYTAREYADLNKEGIKAAFDNYKELESRDTKLGPHNAHRITYTGEASGIAAKWVQWFLTDAEYGYVITYTGDPEGDFDLYLPEAEAMADTFRLLN
jgi:hypothetical protein